MKKGFSLYLMGTVVVLASGLAWSQTTQPVVPETAQPTTQKATDVVATLGDQKLTRGELETIKKYLAPNMPADQEKRLIEAWKMVTALSNEARKSGIDKNPELEPLLNLFTDQALSDLYMRVAVANIKVTDEEVKAYYEAHKDEPQFREGYFVTAKVIAAEKREEIDAIRKELTEGKDFDQVFEANIEKTKKITGLSDPAINNVLSTQLATNLGQPVAGALTMVALNEVIGPRPLPENKGFVIFKVTEKKPGNLVPLDKVSDQIRQMLQQQKQMTARQEIIQKAEKEAGIVRQMPPMGPGAGPRPAPQTTTKPAGK